MIDAPRSAPEAAGFPLVSVILPTRNRAHVLLRAIESVLGQTVHDLELIVLDDASTDGTNAVVTDLGTTDPRINVYRTDTPVGAAAARNIGIQRACGRYIAFNDDDDEWLPTKLERQLEVLESRPSVGAVYCPLVRVEQNGEKRVVGQHGGEAKLRSALLRGNFIGTPTVIIRRELLVSAGGFNEELAALEDWELWLRLAARTEVARVSEPLVRSYVTSGGISSRSTDVADACRRLLAWLEQEPGLTLAELADGLSTLGHMLMLEGAPAEGRRILWRSVGVRPWPPRHVLRALLSTFGARPYRWLAQMSDAFVSRRWRKTSAGIRDIPTSDALAPASDG